MRIPLRGAMPWLHVLRVAGRLGVWWWHRRVCLLWHAGPVHVSALRRIGHHHLPTHLRHHGLPLLEALSHVWRHCRMLALSAIYGTSLCCGLTLCLLLRRHHHHLACSIHRHLRLTVRHAWTHSIWRHWLAGKLRHARHMTGHLAVEGSYLSRWEAWRALHGTIRPELLHLRCEMWLAMLALLRIERWSMAWCAHL